MRNTLIRKQRAAGQSIPSLAAEFRLSISRIEKIVAAPKPAQEPVSAAELSVRAIRALRTSRMWSIENLATLFGVSESDIVRILEEK